MPDSQKQNPPAYGLTRLNPAIAFLAAAALCGAVKYARWVEGDAKPSIVQRRP